MRTDEELLAGAARGESIAFERFYRRWLAAVISYHRRATGSPELALDLAAETFAAAVASVGRFDRDQGSAATWLFAIARHKLHDSFRRAQVEASARHALEWTRVEFDDDDLERVEEFASDGALDLDRSWSGCLMINEPRWLRGCWRSATTRRSLRTWRARRWSCVSAPIAACGIWAGCWRSPNERPGKDRAATV